MKILGKALRASIAAGAIVTIVAPTAGAATSAAATNTLQAVVAAPAGHPAPAARSCHDWSSDCDDPYGNCGGW
ncbi:MAG TPA: hypothetical protein VHV82_19050 [Sporichthyaceae bacterium]|nr:hypothetical protein [Sporichthyaceae bacterium]